MSTPDPTEPTLDEHGFEVHPSWVVIGANRVDYGPPGTRLFNSEVTHQHTIIVWIARASRKRDVSHDYIHPGEEIIQVEMSMSQWGAFVSSMGQGSGVPVTLARYEGHPGRIVEGAEFESRFARSYEEATGAAWRMVQQIQEAYDAVEAARERKAPKREIDELMFHLKAMIKNTPANARYATQVLVKHAEDVVNKAKADIEAIVDDRARQLGIEAPSTEVFELGRGTDE